MTQMHIKWHQAVCTSLIQSPRSRALATVADMAHISTCGGQFMMTSSLQRQTLLQPQRLQSNTGSHLSSALGQHKTR